LTVTPEDQHIKIFAIPDKRADFNIGARKVWRCIEQVKQIANLRDQARIEGKRRTHLRTVRKVRSIDESFENLSDGDVDPHGRGRTRGST
jgi:hypothetical protein